MGGHEGRTRKMRWGRGRLGTTSWLSNRRLAGRNSTPVEHERTEYLRRRRQGGQIEPFVGGVPVAPSRTVAPGRNTDEVVVAHVVNAGAGFELEWCAENLLVPVVE